MGLQANDLKDMVYKVFEIDNYQSKMGSDSDISVLSFSVKDQQAAEDLEKFIETGYNFVLDADATSGEQSDGTYKVFIEIERTKDLPSNILEVVDGVKKLSNLEDVKFRYYKNFKSFDVTEENITNTVPTDKTLYDDQIQNVQLESYKDFFNKSFVESVDMIEDIITIKKSYADPVHFRFVDYGPTVKTLESIKESFNANDFAEIIFLSKYVGDYNITKYGNKLTFENSGNTLVVERIQ